MTVAILCLCAIALRAQIPDERVVWAFKGIGDSNSVEFLASGEQLARNPEWQLDNDFPLPLHGLSPLDSPNTKFRLSTITIKRLIDHSTATGFQNRWFAAFQFLSQEENIRKEYASLRLLSGDFLTRRERLPTNRRANSQADSSAANGRPVSGIWMYCRTDVVHRLRSLQGNFKLPHVQWDSSHERFPLDISIEARRARKALAQSESVPETALNLCEICVTHYLPAEEVEAQGLEITNHLNHWVVIFTFCQGKGEKTEDWRSAAMLLDGRLLE